MIALARPFPTTGPSGPAVREPAPVTIATLPSSRRAPRMPGSPVSGSTRGSSALTGPALPSTRLRDAGAARLSGRPATDMIVQVEHVVLPAGSGASPGREGFP